MANPYEDVSREALVENLTDTQGSLAAALARIEAYRIRERQLMEELSQLRQQVHGHHIDEVREAMKASQGGASTAATTSRPASASALKPADLQSLGTCSITVSAPPAPTEWTSTSGNAPLYVTSLEGGEHAVTLVQGGKKVNCSLIVGKDHIDFVELRARIHNHEFLGISSIKESRSQGSLQEAAAAGGGEAGEAQGEGQGHAATRAASRGVRGTWEVHLRAGTSATRTIKFEASQATRTTLHRHTERWLGNTDDGDDGTGADDASGERGALAQPKNLIGGGALVMQLVGEPSNILGPQQLSALASAVPPLERLRPWSLSYSTRVHGTSLSTLYRRSAAAVPTITLVKDSGGYVFGSYTPEGWHVAPRFYGSGETFVFQLEPHRLMWPWRPSTSIKNDFFQYATPECLALGGTGHFALHLDQELLAGSSGVCGTFGSPCLASRDDFKILLVEVWQAGA